MQCSMTTRRDGGCLLLDCTCGFAKCLPLDDWLSWKAAESEAETLRKAHLQDFGAPLATTAVAA